MRLDKTFGLLSGLSGTYRFSNAKLIHRESVLEHLGAVTLMSYLIVTEMKVVDKGVSTEWLGEILSRAIVHDVEELLIGDVPRTTKYASRRTRETFRALEKNALERIVSDLELASEALECDHSNAKEGAAGLVVKIADVLAVAYTLNSEVVERGNTALMSRAGSCRPQIEELMKAVRMWKNPQLHSFLGDLLGQAIDIVDRAERRATGVAAIEERRSGEAAE